MIFGSFTMPEEFFLDPTVLSDLHEMKGVTGADPELSPQPAWRVHPPPIRMSGRRTILAYEPRHGEAPIQRIAVELDESGQWSVVVDGVVLREHSDVFSAIEDARWLERAPVLAARERDGIIRKRRRGLTSRCRQVTSGRSIADRR
jgi:hypothetical protein